MWTQTMSRPNSDSARRSAVESAPPDTAAMIRSSPMLWRSKKLRTAAVSILLKVTLGAGREDDARENFTAPGLQMRCGPAAVKFGGGDWSRTSDLALMRRPL